VQTGLLEHRFGWMPFLTAPVIDMALSKIELGFASSKNHGCSFLNYYFHLLFNSPVLPEITAG